MASLNGESKLSNNCLDNYWATHHIYPPERYSCTYSISYIHLGFTAHFRAKVLYYPITRLVEHCGRCNAKAAVF